MNRSVDPALLPTLPQLYRATVAAVLVAVALTITTVLPAELGVDPTGVGTALGLTAMGQLKQEADANKDRAQAPVPAGEYGFRSDETSLTLGPNQGTEVKLTMRAGDELAYSWSTDGGELFFDFHGDPIEGGDFTSYEKSTLATTKGTFEASFEGLHGWYWKNPTSAPVTLVLNTSGVYQSITELR